MGATRTATGEMAGCPETFVKMFDVPWTSDRQVALEDGDHMQVNREHPPLVPRPLALEP